MPQSNSSDFMDAPKFQYDMDFDLRYLKDALRRAEFLDESGYQSVLERSQHSQYGTGGWINDNISEADSKDMDDNWGIIYIMNILKYNIKVMLKHTTFSLVKSYTKNTKY
uniref:Yae1_N domain-containing protein n=1 Tax=Syphacia muris TaxID=451379 RepID=A0A0N5ADL2_9BILA